MNKRQRESYRKKLLEKRESLLQLVKAARSSETEANDNYLLAATINPGAHTYPIHSYVDSDWYRIPVTARNSTVTARPLPAQS